MVIDRYYGASVAPNLGNITCLNYFYILCIIT